MVLLRNLRTTVASPKHAQDFAASAVFLGYLCKECPISQEQIGFYVFDILVIHGSTKTGDRLNHIMGCIFNTLVWSIKREHFQRITFACSA